MRFRPVSDHNKGDVTRGTFMVDLWSTEAYTHAHMHTTQRISIKAPSRQMLKHVNQEPAGGQDLKEGSVATQPEDS